MLIPYRVDVFMQRVPVANLVVMSLTILISIAMFRPLRTWEEEVAWRRDLSPELRELIDTFRPSSGSETVVDAFVLQPDHFRPTQLVGNLFIHAGWLHLAGNMLFLFVFGNAVNEKLGHAKYIMVYMASGLLESLAWLILGPGAPCLGARGAIMGVIGAFLVLYPRNEVSIAYWLFLFWRGVFRVAAMWVIAVYVGFDVLGLVLGRSSGVAYLAHVVGFFVGASFTATLVWARWVEMDANEMSLLQVWGWAPHERRRV